MQNRTVTIMVPPLYRSMASLSMEQHAGLNPPSTSAAEEKQVPAGAVEAAEGGEEVSTYAVGV